MVDFKKLVEEQAARERSAEADLAASVQKRGEIWPRRVQELLTQIGQWIGPLVESGSLRYDRKKVLLHEEALAAYEAEAASIRLGGKTLRIDPVGTYLIGAFGRIDVTGPIGKVVWLLLGSDIESAAWHIAHPVAAAGPRPLRAPSTRAMRATFEPLTKESFEQLFVDLLGIQT
jgi:hypothetical protein